MTHPPRSASALLLTIALHLALLAALLARHNVPKAPAAADPDRPAIAWILPAPRTAAVPALPPLQTAGPAPVRRARAAAPQTITEPRSAGRAAVTPAETAPAVTAAPAVAEPTIGDLSTQPAAAPVSAAELLRLTLHGAGKIDQELRGGKLAPLPPPGQTMRGKIDAAFEAAHQAVRPKWYERAKVSEISSPNSRIRVYKIRTALGTYCISMADASMHGGGYSAPSYSNCP